MHGATEIGRRGEFLAAFKLETAGIEAHHVDRNGSDLWCRLPSGLIVAVQVKAASQARTRGKRNPSYFYQLNDNPSEFDWYCFIALDIERMILKPSGSLEKKSHTILMSQFTNGAEAETIAQMKMTPRNRIPGVF